MLDFLEIWGKYNVGKNTFLNFFKIITLFLVEKHPALV